jgi:hypothetical protein
MNVPHIRPTPSDRFNRPRTRDGRGQAAPRQSAEQSYRHYLALARDRALAGDQIEAERYYQYAEHYLRSIDSSAA